MQIKIVQFITTIVTNIMDNRIRLFYVRTIKERERFSIRVDSKFYGLKYSYSLHLKKYMRTCKTTIMLNQWGDNISVFVGCCCLCRTDEMFASRILMVADKTRNIPSRCTFLSARRLVLLHTFFRISEVDRSVSPISFISLKFSWRSAVLSSYSRCNEEHDERCCNRSGWHLWKNFVLFTSSICCFQFYHESELHEHSTISAPLFYISVHVSYWNKIQRRYNHLLYNSQRRSHSFVKSF